MISKELDHSNMCIILPHLWDHISKFALVIGTVFQSVALIMGPSSDFSKAYINQTPYRSYPLSLGTIGCMNYQTAVELEDLQQP